MVVYFKETLFICIRLFETLKCHVQKLQIVRSVDFLGGFVNLFFSWFVKIIVNKYHNCSQEATSVESSLSTICKY